MEPAALDALRAYVGFDEQDELRLHRLAVHCEVGLESLVTDFYSRILEHPETRALIVDDEQLCRLRGTLMGWVRSLLVAPRDPSYLSQRFQIGRRHLEIGLPLYFTPLAMQIMRRHLHEWVAPAIAALTEREQTHAAIDRALDLEQALIIASYLDSYTTALRERERLATVGRLAALVSNELQNPLGVIRTSRFLLEQHLAERGAAGGGEDELAQRHLGRIERAAAQAGALASHLHEYTQARGTERRRVRLNALLEESVSLVKELEGAEVRIEVAVEPAEAEVVVRPSDLVRAVAHLVRNSVQSLGGDGRAAGKVRIEGRLGDGSLVIDVVDDGPGMDPTVRQRCFEPLFSTRAFGTGLGLGIVQNQVEAHGGRVELESEPGRGTRVRLILPQEREPGP